MTESERVLLLMLARVTAIHMRFDKQYATAAMVEQAMRMVIEEGGEGVNFSYTQPEYRS